MAVCFVHFNLVLHGEVWNKAFDGKRLLRHRRLATILNPCSDGSSFVCVTIACHDRILHDIQRDWTAERVFELRQILRTGYRGLSRLHCGREKLDCFCALLDSGQV